MVQGMRRTKPDSSLLPTQAAQSLAVAVAIVFLAHMAFWMAALSATVANGFGEPARAFWVRVVHDLLEAVRSGGWSVIFVVHL